MSRTKTTREMVFEKICSIAEDGDAEYLQNLLSLIPHLQVDFSVYYLSILVPVMQLAASRKHAAVTFLIEKFGADISAAAEGYARIGEVDKIEELLRRNANPKQVLRGYAYAGDVARVELMLRNGGIDDAIRGYALAGNTEQVNKLIAQGGSELSAVYGYIESGYLEKAEAIILASLHKWNFSVYKSCYTMFEYLDGKSDKLLTLLSSTNNTALRLWFAIEAKKSFNPTGLDDLIKKAEKINHFMNEYHLNFEQAQVLLQQGVLTWLLQGQQNISRDVYLLIAQQLTGLSMRDTQAIVAAVCKTTHDQAAALIEQRYKPSIKARFFSLFGDDSLKHQAEANKASALNELEKKYITPTRRVGSQRE